MLKNLVLVAVLLAPLSVVAQGALPQSPPQPPPQPPCGAAPYPVAGAIAGAPSVGTWTGAELRRMGWQPAACLGWTGGSRFVAALAGEFASRETSDQLLARLAAFSAYPAIKYWSVSHQAWQPLALEAGALSALDLTPGHDNVYFERNGNTGRTSYRLRVLERTENRLVIATENTTPIGVAILTAFEPGALQAVSFLDRRGPAAWSFYQIARAGENSSALVAGRESSLVNRLVAFYRYLAGIQTDLEPPAMR